jgi:GTPase KRas protein
MSLNSKGEILTIVMLGAGATGKSSITVQQVSGHFLALYDPTIEDSYRTSILIDGEQIIFNILDTAGQEEYSALRDSYIRSGDAYICVCSLISMQSLIELHELLNQIKMILDIDNFNETPIIIAANKCDLVDQIEIKNQDLEDIKSNNGIDYIKTSAKNKINITLLFETIIKRYLELEKLKHKDDGNINVIDNRKNKRKCIML